jgi:hypothetical protein
LKPLFAFLAFALVGCAGPSSWEFSEVPSKLVVTQRTVIQKKQPILYVIHDNDGEWQFLADERVQLDPVVQLTIRELVAIDSSIVDVAYLKKGWKAWRASKDSPWNSGVYR